MKNGLVIHNNIADVICTTANDKQLVIEIVVTHDLDNDKRNYLRANEITTLRIDVNNWDYQTQRLNEYMLQGNNIGFTIKRQNWRKRGLE